MSEKFFNQLSIPDADINLKIGSGTHAAQVGQTMIELGKILVLEKPDWVVIVGDVNAVLAASVTAKKENIKCCHIEAGLRSYDMTMPEEINRLVADRLSDLLLTPDLISYDNLLKEGISKHKICFVGNIMIDTLDLNLEYAKNIKIADILGQNRLMNFSEHEINCHSLSQYIVITLHRPSNVDNKEVLERVVNFVIEDIAHESPIFWPLHPRTHKMLHTFNLFEKIQDCDNLVLLHPLGYMEMLRLNLEARMIITDSGGLQEEFTVLGTPCLTLRWNTERPVTLTEFGGASILVGNDINRLRDAFNKALSKERRPFRPDLWDGHAAERCLKAILEYKA